LGNTKSVKDSVVRTDVKVKQGGERDSGEKKTLIDGKLFVRKLILENSYSEKTTTTG